MSHHTFDINIAKEYGLEAAILIHHILYWVEYNERQGKNFHEGRYWMYQKQEEMANHFPYMDFWKIHKILKELVKKGVILKNNFNENKFVKTCWYTLKNKEMFTKLPNSNLGIANQQSPDCQLATSLYTNTKTNTKDNRQTDKEDEPKPKKVGRSVGSKEKEKPPEKKTPPQKFILPRELTEEEKTYVDDWAKTEEEIKGLHWVQIADLVIKFGLTDVRKALKFHYKQQVKGKRHTNSPYKWIQKCIEEKWWENI